MASTINASTTLGLQQTADTSGVLQLQTANTTSVTIDASQNVGIGTSSPSYLLDLNTANANQIRLTSSSTSGAKMSFVSTSTNGRTWGIGSNFSTGNGEFAFYDYTASAERMRIDSSGNVGIGTSSPTKKLVVSDGGAIGLEISPNDGGLGDTRVFAFNRSTTSYTNLAVQGQDIKITTGTGATQTERMRIDSSGNLLVGTTSALGVGFTVSPSASAPYWQMTLNTASAVNNFYLYNQNATNNGYRFYVNSNGGVYNYSGNNVNLSDERTKTNIKLASSYLDKICAIPVKLFNYKDEAEGEQQTLGVIAQDVEIVAPELVNQDGWIGESTEGEDPLKAIYTTDMMFALMKCIQEQQAIIEQLRADVETLKGNA